MRAPVSGTIKRGGGYTLYCKYSDNFVVIRPDAAPQLEVKVLHITGLAVRRGQHVDAGAVVVTVEAMKMEHALSAPVDGVVELLVAVGDQVKVGQPLARITVSTKEDES